MMMMTNTMMTVLVMMAMTTMMMTMLTLLMIIQQGMKRVTGLESLLISGYAIVQSNDSFQPRLDSRSRGKNNMALSERKTKTTRKD